jgi:3-deoxy-7-phosphoheptulonate synthase
VTRIGRFAGQYAKPRSEEYETRGGVRLPSYRGDIVNRAEFTAEARTPDPQLLLRGYERAALTLNFIRALVKGGFADLHHPEYFDLDWVRHSPLAEEYHRMAATIGDALRFMENVLGVRAGESDRIDFFTAHEALHLGYESAQTRRVPRRPGWFNLTTHFPWVGLRTNHPPARTSSTCAASRTRWAMKVGAPVAARSSGAVARYSGSAADAGAAVADPPLRRAPDRRGAARLIENVRAEGGTVVWICDAMHGNTQLTAGGVKTRLRGHPFGSGAGFRHSPGDGPDVGRRPRRTDRRERHRMHRRRARA